MGTDKRSIEVLILGSVTAYGPLQRLGQCQSTYKKRGYHVSIKEIWMDSGFI